MTGTVSKLNKTRDVVLELLTKEARLRDSDSRLIANIWYKELAALNMTKADCLQAYAEGKLTSPETIRRTRQKLQEENRELRGTSYRMRKADGEQTSKEIVHL